jgi:putative PIG3 family NAD(P)H quinone oxidoreductase
MWAITVERDGDGRPALHWRPAPEPELQEDEVLLAVTAAGVNRADLLQAQGDYPPPPGASDILGLEVSGTVVAVGDRVTGWEPGQAACALLGGGGYAERVAVPAEQLLPVPSGVYVVIAAGLPEVTCTVWSNLVMTAGLRAGQVLLVHGGTSGIGTMAVQVGRVLGATVAVTASRADGLAACRELGAEILVNYVEEDFVERIRAATGGADVVLDVIGAKYLARNVAVLADGGTLVVIGMQGGTRAELDLGVLLRKRGRIAATALRSRPTRGPGSKAEVVAATRAGLWPELDAGRVRPVVDTVLPMDQAQEAHERMATGGHVGKILLQVP